MAQHVLVAASTVDGSTAYAALTALVDSLCASSGTNYVAPRRLLLKGAAAGGLGMTRARAMSPSMLKVAYAQIRPLSAAAVGPSDVVCDMSQRPIVIEPGENLSVAIQNGAANAAYGALFLALDDEPVPAGEAFWIRYSITAAAAATPLVWSSYQVTDTVPLAYETSLPSGTYAAVAMVHSSTTCIAARLILSGFRNRPGVLGSSSVINNVDMFTDGRMGVLGYFTNWQLPGIDVLCVAADTAFEGFIKVIRIGGPEMMPSSR